MMFSKILPGIIIPTIAHALVLVILSSFTPSLIRSHHRAPIKFPFQVLSRSRQPPIHLDPPARSEPSHGPNDTTARECGDANAREKPTVANRRNERLGHNRPYARENIADAVVERHSRGRVGRHELGQHGGDHDSFLTNPYLYH